MGNSKRLEIWLIPEMERKKVTLQVSILVSVCLQECEVANSLEVRNRESQLPGPSYASLRFFYLTRPHLLSMNSPKDLFKMPSIKLCGIELRSSSLTG